MESISIAEAELTVYIHPSMSAKARVAMLQQLSSLLFTYNELFDGVLLSYEVVPKSQIVRILPGLVPYYAVEANAKLLLYSPKPGMFLEGKVVKLTVDSTHIIVLGFSPVTIYSEDIREEFKHKIKRGVSRLASSSHKRHLIKVGGIIRFLVKSFDEKSLHIYGSLNPPNTGCIHWLSEHSAEYASQIDRSVRRPREKEEKGKMVKEPGSPTKKVSLDHHPHKPRKRTSE